MRARQRGVAIVLAMGVVALAAMAATAIMVTQSTWARRSELTSDHVQAQLIIKAGVDWARAVLSDDRRASNVDHLGEPWALRLPPMKKIWDAANVSLRWYERMGEWMKLDPVEFAYSYMTRTGRVNHADVRRRDPDLAAAYERLHPEVRAV